LAKRDLVKKVKFIYILKHIVKKRGGCFVSAYITCTYISGLDCILKIFYGEVLLHFLFIKNKQRSRKSKFFFNLKVFINDAKDVSYVKRC
jgi:hypothetical protein